MGRRAALWEEHGLRASENRGGRGEYLGTFNKETLWKKSLV
jgi:hypothetical protein